MSEQELAALTITYTSGKEFGTELRKLLMENGVAVVTDILDANECAHFRELKKVELEMESPQPGAMSHVQGEIAWKARLHPRVWKSFAHIYQTPALSTSTDITAMFYTREGASATACQDQWLHVDQNTKTGLTHQCYQAVLYINSSAGEASSTTVVWPKSHLDDVYGKLIDDPSSSHKAFRRDEATGILSGHFIPINGLEARTKEHILQEALAGSRRIPVPAGALLLWNSRLVHQGWKGGQRFAVPVCWEPRERVSKEATERKLVMAAAGLGTSHSPSEGRVHPNASTRRGPSVKMEKPRVRPYAVRPEEEFAEADWQELWKDWDGKQFAEEVLPKLDPVSCAAALRPDVLLAL